MRTYQGAFHLHSRYSYDSEIELKEMAPLLQSQGFAFALMSEHTYDRKAKRYLGEQELQNFIQDCERYSSPHFLMVPGLEFACFDNQVHIVVTPLYQPLPLDQIDTAEKIIEAAHNEEALAILVHPFWGNAYQRLEKKTFLQLDGFEVWNYNYQHQHGPSLSQYLKLRKWFQQSQETMAFAGLDLHHKKNVAPIMIEMSLKALTPEAIFQKLHEKDYALKTLRRKFTPNGRIDNLFLHGVTRESDLLARLRRRLFRAR